MNKWVLYTLTLGFAAYWASNLILWYPWSYSTTLGMTLMLTATPILWGYVAFLAIRAYPKNELLRGAMAVAILFLLLAAVLDYFFFGHIRNAMEELYHPTTFYGYGFLLAVPFGLALLLKKKIREGRREVTNPDIVKAGITGLICGGILTGIILLGLEI